jgi:hypothetical protein
MAPSKRPIVDMFGTTWLGDPEGMSFSIEIADQYIGFCSPSGEVQVPWIDIASIEVDIPTANWTAARLSQRILATMDALEVANSNGVDMPMETRRGNSDITVRLVRKDGTEVVGWARKHQPLGYPEPEAKAAIAVLRSRAGVSD